MAFRGLALAFAVVAGYLILQSLTGGSPRLLGGEEIPPERMLERLKTLPAAERQALLAREQKDLASDPLKLTALTNMVLLYEVLGDKGRSQELTVLAGQRSLRDLPVQRAVLQILLDRKDYSGALYRLDGLIRSRPERSAELMQVMISFIDTETARASLVDMLSQDPPWRDTFLSLIGQQSKQIDSVYRVFSALRKTASPVTSPELRPFLQRLITEGSFERANYVWLDFLSDAELRKVAPVFDGNFDLDIGNRFFDWTYKPMKNVDLRIVPRASGSADKVLRVDFGSGRTPFANFSQLLRLEAGQYLLSGEAKSDNLKNEGGLVWRVRCLADASPVIAQSLPLLGTLAWSRFEKSFTVPAQNCATQQLRLELNARAKLDYQISGRVLYDNIAIKKRDGTLASP